MKKLLIGIILLSANTSFGAMNPELEKSIKKEAWISECFVEISKNLAVGKLTIESSDPYAIENFCGWNYSKSQTGKEFVKELVNK